MNSIVRIKITGRNTKRFIKQFLINKNISYSKYKDISYKETLLNINYTDYLKLINNKTTYDIEIVKIYGPYFFIYYIKNNVSFIISFIASLILLYLLSITAFEVKVIHNDKSIRTLVSDELKYYKISKYRIIPRYNKRVKIIDKIVKNNKDKLEWLEIERKGSKLIVKVTERKVNKKEEILKNRHIVAKKSGIIMKIEAKDGVILKKNNDFVTKGDIVISGDIIKDETVKGQVAAKGVVYAEVWYKVNVKYPLYYEEITYLDEIKNNIIIIFFNKEISLKKNYVSSYLEKKRVFIKDKIFPFSVRMERQRKTKVKKESLDTKMAIMKAEEVAEKKIKARLKNDEYIIDKKTLNYTFDNNSILSNVFFKVYEDITDYRLSDEVQIENQTDE